MSSTNPTPISADPASVQRPIVPLWGALILALAFGPIEATAFPVFGVWPLAFPAIAIFLVALIGRRPGGAFLVGFVAGCAFYFIHISWASTFLGPIPESALAILEALFYGAGSVLISLAYRFVPRTWTSRLGRLGLLPVIVAGLWTAREAIQSVWPYGGFAWGRVAESQSQSPFAHLFPWLGISGVSFVCVLLVAFAVELARMSSIRPIARVTMAVVAVALVAIVPTFPVVLHGTTTVAAVQGDGPAGYFDRAAYGELLAAEYNETKTLYGGRKVDMVIWPEGGSDLNPLESPIAAYAFNDVSRRMNAPLLGWAVTHRGSNYYNTSLLWEYGKGVVDYYDKKHPVPFGEYVPDRAFWYPFAPSLIGLIKRQYTPGTTNTVFDVNGVIAGISICFDISDDTVMRDSISSGAQLLVAQTNNADFGHTDESVQQLAIARIRAMELGRTIVNVSTVGTSAVILPDGQTVDQLPTFKPGTMVDTVPLSTTITPASVAGEGIEQFVAALGLGGLLVAWILGANRRLNSKKRRA